MKNARQVVVTALLKMDETEAWSNLTLDSALKKSTLSEQDKGFASALFYGVIARKYTLDACINKESTRSFRTIDITVLSILRSAFYQLLYMDSVPDYSAVDEAVTLTRVLRVASASGFVNGILRSFLRNKKAIPILTDSLANSLGVEYSCPPPLVEEFLASYGKEDTIKLLEESLTAPVTFLRVNTLKINSATLQQRLLEQHSISTTAHPTLANCFIVASGGALHTLPEYKEGLFHLQDSSSQECALQVAAKAGERILDACSAPGGKTFIIAEEMKNSGEIIATDLHQHRLNQLEERAKLLGITIIKAQALDMKVPHPELGEFDRILCDVPCSGLGVLRRRPEIKYKNLKDFERLPQIQFEILNSVAKYCKKGGLLVYSTCTLSSKENTEVVHKFLQQNPEFRPSTEGSSWEKTIFPSASGGDGFYIAVLQRM